MSSLGPHPAGYRGRVHGRARETHGLRFPTLADVAVRAHVSQSTVSKVVRGLPNVSPELRALVLDAVADLDYRPNDAGRALADRHPEGHVTLAVPDLGSAYYRRLAAAVLQRTRAADLHTVVVQTGGDPEFEQRLTTDPLGDGRGLLLAVRGIPEPPSPLTAERSRPVVVMGDDEGPCPYDRVSFDSTRAADVCTTHLLDRGRTRLALVGAEGRVPHASARARQRGFEQALLRHGLPVVPSRTPALPSWTARAGEAATERLLAEDPAVDGIVAACDEIAFGVLHALRRAGRRVPDDVAVTGFDDVDDAAHSTPTLTTVRLPHEEIAKVAVAMLVRRLDDGHDDGPPRSHLASGRLVVRDSA